MNPRIVLMNF